MDLEGQMESSCLWRDRKGHVEVGLCHKSDLWGLKIKHPQKILQMAQKNLLILDFLHFVSKRPLDHVFLKLSLDHGLFPNYIYRKCKATFILALLKHY